MQAGGALIGPHALGIIQDVEGVRHLAELGVVFLLFNIGLELSLERLRSMQKYVFGMGTAQVRSPCMHFLKEALRCLLRSSCTPCVCSRSKADLWFYCAQVAPHGTC